MAKLNRRSISRRTVEALKVEKDTVFWDRGASTKSRPTNSTSPFPHQARSSCPIESAAVTPRRMEAVEATKPGR